MKILEWMSPMEFNATGAFAFGSYLLWIAFILEIIIEILEELLEG